MRRINVGPFVYSLFIPVMVGIISAAISSRGMEIYKVMEKPPLSPPAWVFSVVWTILYLVMGLSSYLIIEARTDVKSKAAALMFYGIQLFMNFMWSILFFNLGMYMFSFIWLVIMLCVVVICAFKFFYISSLAGFLLVPYILWLSFAAYLNLGAYMLSRPL